MAEDRLAELYRRFAPTVYRRCIGLLGDREEARDATHDIFLKLHAKADTFRGESSPGTWIYRVATNHCLNRLRAQGVRRRAHRRIADESSPRFNRAAEARMVERRDLIRHLLREFDTRKVQIVIHAHYDEMTQREIGELLGISERAVRKSLSKVVSRVRERGRALTALEEGETS